MTGIIYDELMCRHETSGHPERPERIETIYEQIKNSGLLIKCVEIPIREATRKELESVHTIDYINKMSLIPSLNPLELLKLKYNYNSVYFNNHTWNSALLSAGGVIELCDQVVQGNVPNGIAIVRPPGHHAESSEAMGFCIFNNVAIAAKAMINKYGLKRLAIIDWDVHHGNATQRMFIDDPSVLYISIHRYDNANFYPCSTDADPSIIGYGEAIGKNVNIAWNSYGVSKIGNSEYVYAFNEIIEPMFKEYDPELIIISAGFDCAAGDPLGGLDVTPLGFNYLTKKIKNFANGKIVIALEGGYNVDVIADSMLACLKGLLNEPFDGQISSDVSPVAIKAVNKTIKAHRSHWKFLPEIKN
jgi:acetoin utilization deacetylase AcuC-like enzyme